MVVFALLLTAPATRADSTVVFDPAHITFGDVECGVSASRTVAVALRRSGEPNDPFDVDFRNGSAITFSVASRDPLALGASFSNAQIQLPDDWTAEPDGTLSPAAELTI